MDIDEFRRMVSTQPTRTVQASTGSVISAPSQAIVSSGSIGADVIRTQQQAATLRGIAKPTAYDFDYALMIGAGYTAALCGGIENVEAFSTNNLSSQSEAWVREKLPTAYVILLRMTSAVDSLIDGAGVQAFKRSVVHKGSDIGKFLDSNFRTGVYAQSPQVSLSGASVVSAEDFVKKEWQDFLWAKRADIAECLVLTPRFVVTDMLDHSSKGILTLMGQTAPNLERFPQFAQYLGNNGVSDIQKISDASGNIDRSKVADFKVGAVATSHRVLEARSHILNAKCVDKEALCSGVENPRLLATAVYTQAMGQMPRQR